MSRSSRFWDRRGWTRSLAIAIALHTVLLGALLASEWPSTANLATPNVPIASIRTIPAENRADDHALVVRPMQMAVEFNERPVTAVADEPDDAAVVRAAQSILSASPRPTDDQALGELARAAAMLQRISSETEIGRMAGKITSAVDAGLPAAPDAKSSSQSGDFDFEESVVSSSARTEENGVTRISETLSDAAGRRMMLTYVRRVDPLTRQVRFEQLYQEGDHEPVVLGLSEEEFAAAEERHRPFEIIDRFPLVRQLHRQAVLPILRRLASRAAETGH